MVTLCTWGDSRIFSFRALGANPDPHKPDLRMKELVDEIVRLGTEFGILTEYTAFLAKVRKRLDAWDAAQG